MKKIIIIIFSVILLAVIGRFVWAYIMVLDDNKKEAEKVALLNAEKERQEAIKREEEARIVALEEAEIERCGSLKQENEIKISGQVVFPKGIKNKEDYRISAIHKLYPDDTFCAYATNGKINFLTASSRNTEKDFSLFFVVLSVEDMAVTIDALSTATALVFMDPSLVQSDAVKTKELLTKIQNDKKVIEFANQISNKNILTNADIKKGGMLYRAYTNAVASVKKTLATEKK